MYGKRFRHYRGTMVQDMGCACLKSQPNNTYVAEHTVTRAVRFLIGSVIIAVIERIEKRA